MLQSKCRHGTRKKNVKKALNKKGQKFLSVNAMLFYFILSLPLTRGGFVDWDLWKSDHKIMGSPKTSWPDEERGLPPPF